MDQREAGRRAVALAVIALAATLPFLPALLRNEVLIFRDHADYFIPLRWFTANALRAGELPFWNPFSGSGELWLANPQTAVFYPPAAMFVLLPFTLAFNLFLAVHMIILGVGAYSLFRRVATSSSSLLATLTLTCSGPIVSMVDVQNNIASLAWVPWSLGAALDVRSSRGDYGAFARTAIFLSFTFLAGEPLIAMITVMMVVVIILRTLRDAVRVALLGALTVALTSPQLLPFLILLQGSDRAGGFTTGDSLRNTVRLVDWLSVVSPGVAVRSQQFVPLMFLSTLALLFAFGGGLAVLDERVRRYRRAIVAAAATLAIAAMGTAIPIAGELFAALLWRTSRYPARLLPLVVLFVCFLAAIGLDYVVTLGRPRRIACVATILALTVAAALTLRAFSVWLLLDLAMAIAVFSRPRSNVLRWSAALVIVAMSFLVARPLFRSASFESLQSPIAPHLKKDAKVVRVEVDERQGWQTERKTRLMSGYLNLLHAQFDASTPSPVISRRYLALLEQAVTPRFELLRFLGVQNIVSERELPIRGLDKVVAAPVHVYRFPNGLRVVSLWSDVVRAPDAAAAYALASKNTSAADIHVAGSRLLPGRATVQSEGRAVVRAFAANRLQVLTETPAPALLLLGQNAAAGWQVSVDGKPARALEANGIFRAVELPAGRHEVEWRYEPPYLNVTLMVSLIALSFCFVLISRRWGRHTIDSVPE